MIMKNLGLDLDDAPVAPDVYDYPADRYRERYMGVTRDAYMQEQVAEEGEPLTELAIRLDELRCLNVRDWGRGDVAIATVTADNLSTKPFELNLQSFQSVADGQKLKFGVDGLTVYQNEPAGTIPRWVQYRFLAVESDAEVREAAQWLEDLQKDPGYGKIRDALIAGVGVAQPQIGVVAAGVDLLMQFIAARLKANRDDQLIFVAGSWNAKLDHLREGVRTAYSGNDYAQLTYSIRAG